MSHIGYNTKAAENQINATLVQVFNSPNLRDLFEQNSRKGPTRLYVKPFLYFDELNAMLVAEKLAITIDHLRQLTEAHFFEPASATVKRQRVDDFNRGNDIVFEFGDRHTEFYYHFPHGTLVLCTDKRTIPAQETFRDKREQQSRADMDKANDEANSNVESHAVTMKLRPLDSSDIVTDVVTLVGTMEEMQRKVLEELRDQLKLCMDNNLSEAEVQISMRIKTITRK